MGGGAVRCQADNMSERNNQGRITFGIGSAPDSI